MSVAIDGGQISLTRGDGNSTGLCTSDGCAVVGVGGGVDDGVGDGFGGFLAKSAVGHLPKNFTRRNGGIKGTNFSWSINLISILWSRVTVGRGEVEDERLKRRLEDKDLIISYS